MLKQIAGVSIWSSDLNNLLPFYRDVLGLKVLLESPRFVALGTDQSDFPMLGLGSHSDVTGPNTDPARHMLGFDSSDIFADWERLKALGVEFVEDPADSDELIIATLKDPEGNLVQLFQQPGK